MPVRTGVLQKNNPDEGEDEDGEDDDDMADQDSTKKKFWTPRV